MRYLLFIFLLGGCVYSPNNSVNLYAPNVMVVAESMVGLNEQEHRRELKYFLGVDPVRYEWCAAFVNSILNLYSIPGSESVSQHPLLARSFLDWGTPVETPMKGDIVIFPRGNQGWQGHVGFYVETEIIDGEEHWIILGGNQDSTVSYKPYLARRALGIRRYE
jgi:uncharacterized protein (TIGR02594 family)